MWKWLQTAADLNRDLSVLEEEEALLQALHNPLHPHLPLLTSQVMVERRHQGNHLNSEARSAVPRTLLHPANVGYTISNAEDHLRMFITIYSERLYERLWVSNLWLRLRCFHYLWHVVYFCWHVVLWIHIRDRWWLLLSATLFLQVKTKQIHVNHNWSFFDCLHIFLRHCMFLPAVCVWLPLAPCSLWPVSSLSLPLLSFCSLHPNPWPCSQNAPSDFSPLHSLHTDIALGVTPVSRSFNRFTVVHKNTHRPPVVSSLHNQSLGTPCRRNRLHSGKMQSFEKERKISLVFQDREVKTEKWTQYPK